MRFYYQLTTIDPIVISANNATANNHNSLDYIPGSAILGALAAEYYPHLSAEDSWLAFHSGNVCFSPAYPIANKQLCLPVPASWHYEKGKNAVENEQFHADMITNHACRTFERDSKDNHKKQFKQCREGYVGATGVSATVRQSVISKTAIDSDLGNTKDGQLFSYTYIDAGQEFAGWIDCADEKLFKKFKQSLQGTLHIGRSRNSEFGRVSSRVVKMSIENNPLQTSSKSIVIWCLSDCEMLDSNGLPTFTPKLSALHHQLQGTLNRELSFIRSSRISRFNQKRRGLDSEQLLITKGSILVYDLLTPVDSQVLEALQTTGIGRNRQQGLGWISINPQWALTATLSNKALFPALKIIVKEFKKKHQKISSPLIHWLNSQLETEQSLLSRQKRATDLLIKIIKAYSNARSYNNIYLSNEAGPSANQWRRISDKVRNSNSNNWKQGVFEGDNAICKANNDEFGWGIEWSEENSLTTFADFVTLALQHEELLTMRTLLDQLCRYDLSTHKGLKTIKQELKLDTNNGEKSL